MSAPLIVYTNSAIRCPYCIRAKQSLAEREIEFDERDIADLAVRAELMAKRPTARTVPQIFISNGYYIGGCDDLSLLIQQGRLDLLIELNHDDRE